MSPRYQRVADALRQQILDGTLPVGAAVPSAETIAKAHNVGRDTALKGLSILRSEGLLFLAPDRSIRVGPMAARHTRGGTEGPEEMLRIPAGSVGRARMPTRQERDRLDIPTGVPVLVIVTGDHEELYAADRYGFRY